VAVHSEDAAAFHVLASLPGPFLPWTAYSMRPAAIVAVLSDIAIFDRDVIVECGSGNSTVFAARLLAQRAQGHVISVDHESEWADRTSAQLAREKLEEWATVVHAPLVDGWYDVSRIPEVPDVELLVVDGPPAASREKEDARWPAMDFFSPRLSAQASVIVDDARRPGERRLLAEWEKRYGRRFCIETGGYAVSTPDIT
jgi:hypothetical protein